MVTPVDTNTAHPAPCNCAGRRDPCCRTHPLILAGFIGGWVVAAMLAGLLLGLRLAH